MNILYVDDEKTNLFLFSANFEFSFNVLTALSGDEALELINAGSDQISAVITDMRMPKMNGVELVKRLKSEHPELPCFILTGFEFNAEIDAAVSEHLIEKVFKKPFNKEEITSALELLKN